MDLDELKEKWAEYDEKLETNIRLNQQLLRAVTLSHARSALQRLIMGLALEVAFDLAAIVAMSSFLYDNRAQRDLAFPAAALDLFTIAVFIALVRQIVFASQIRPLA